MKKRRLWITAITVMMCAGLVTACGKSEREVEQTIDTQEVETQEIETQVTTQVEMNSETSEVGQAETEKSFDFAMLSNLEFYFSSGVGGWSTSLTIHEDGSFEGNYYDSDMGSTGDGYPNGTEYVCDFSGQFTQPELVNEYTYKMKIDSINLASEPGTEEIKDDIKYVSSEPYGLEDAQDILIYLPGAPTDQLPEEYMGWVNYTEASTSTELPFYGLYNEAAQNGFSSYENTDATADTEETASAESTSGNDKLADVEAQAAALEKRLAEEDLTQLDMNNITGELYKLWDDELNTIWGELKDTLDEDTMASLLEEQRAWITSKEEAITAAGAEYEGGTIQTSVEYSKGAELTKARVYELVKLLP